MSGPPVALIFFTLAGNVGIGTTNPRDRLDIVSGGTVYIDLQGPSGATASGIQFWDGPGPGVTDRQAYFQYRTDTTPDRFEFATRNTGGTEDVRMVVDQDGNVGIGTASTGYDLDVRKTKTNGVSVRIRNDATAAGSIAQLVIATAGVNDPYIIFDVNAGAASWHVGVDASDGNTFKISRGDGALGVGG